VVLTGRLSNPQTGVLLQRLTSRDWKQATANRRAAHGVAPDGRRRFGSVSAAIVQVLSAAETDLRVRDIQAEVDRLLGSSVSRHSIKGYLHSHCQGKRALFERTGRGRYRLSRLTAS
jgi:hypothetical protein